MKTKTIRIFLISILTGIIMGCASTQQHLLDSDQSQLQLRSIQSRYFDTTDRGKTLRTIIATLQDLGFVVDKADDVLGTVSATKLDHYSLKITVSVRPRGKTQTLVRANVQYGLKPVTNTKTYQDFFIALGKAMFLTANQVD